MRSGNRYRRLNPFSLYLLFSLKRAWPKWAGIVPVYPESASARLMAERGLLMETIEIRPAVAREELEQAYDIWGTVFPENRSFFQERLDFDSEYAMDTTFLAYVNRRLAAAIQIFPFRMHWGSVPLKVGGIGNVATLPEFRRRGLAQQLLRRQCRYMFKQGYDLSLLMTGINSFYEQLGWRTVQDPEWVADAAALRTASSPGSSRIRRYHEDDLDQVSSIYDNRNDEMIAPRQRTKAYWRGQSLWQAVRPEQFLVAEESGRIVAFMRYKTSGDELQLLDCGCQPAKEQAVLDLLHQILTNEPQVTVLKAALPSGHILDDFLNRNGGRTVPVGYKLWRSFHLNGTLRKIAPEIERNIRNAPIGQLPESLLFIVDGEEALVTMKQGTVEVTPVGKSVRYQAVVELTGQEWLVLLLKGYEALEQREKAGMEYLRVLFPKRPYIFWPVDHF
jgi:GNAT superfamily N-acetyltransferase